MTKTKNTIKSTQEQAVASWIEHLRDLRIADCIEKLEIQDGNFEEALKELEKLKKSIYDEVIQKNRGGLKGMHGFIGERAQVSIENARNILNGVEKEYFLIDDNGAIDYLRNSTPIQQKCVQLNKGLNAIKEHLNDYPNFLKNGGKYQIPKDYHEKIKELLSLSPEKADELKKQLSELKAIDPNSPQYQELAADYNLWKRLLRFFQDSEITPNDIEPMVVDYADIQVNAIDNTIEKEAQNLNNWNENLKDIIEDDHKPTFAEGAKATIASAAIEGGVTFALAMTQKLRDGKKLNEFTAEDWKDVGIDTGKSAFKGGVRGATVYMLTNYTVTPANVASALVTATFGMLSQANEFRKGNIDAEEFLINSEVVCLDVTISAVSSLLGQELIPIPVLGAVIGNAVGTFMYGIAKEYGLKKEQECIERYRFEINQLNEKLDKQYRELVELLNYKFKAFQSVIELAFNEDINIAFQGSIELAQMVGVSDDKILKTKDDIDKYFTM